MYEVDKRIISSLYLYIYYFSEIKPERLCLMEKRRGVLPRDSTKVNNFKVLMGVYTYTGRFPERYSWSGRLSIIGHNRQIPWLEVLTLGGRFLQDKNKR